MLRRCAVIFFPVVLYAVLVSSDEGPLESLQGDIEALRADLNVPGVAVVVSGLTAEPLFFVSGYIDAGSLVPVTPDTRFHIASVTKTFNATLAAMLVDDGSLTWDTRVRDIVPEFQLVDNFAAQRATLRDLLCHRVGIGRNSLPSFNRADSPEWWLPRLKLLSFESEFRDSVYYSGVMVTVSGIMLARAGGAPWESLLKQRLLKPLEMNATTAGYPRDPAALVAVGHVSIDGELRAMPLMQFGVDVCQSGLYSSAADMGRWMDFLLGRTRNDTGELLLQKFLADTWTPQAVKRRVGNANDPAVHAWGLGWEIWCRNGERWLHHAGGGPGYTSEIILIPDRGVGVAVLTNSAVNPIPDLVGTWVMDRLQGRVTAYPRERVLAMVRAMEQMNRAAQKHMLAEKEDGAEIPVSLDVYTGVYSDELYGSMIVTSVNNTLEIRFHGIPMDVIHLHDHVFLVSHPLTGYLRSEFEIMEDGSVKGVHVLLGSQKEDILFTRQGNGDAG